MNTSTVGHTGIKVKRSTRSIRHRNTARQKPLGERLVSAGVITREELESGLQEQSSRGLRLGETLIALGFVEESELLPFLAEQMQVRYVQLRDGLVDPKIVKLIPQPMAEAIGCLAMCRVRNRLSVAMTDPTDLAKIDQIAHATGLQVRPVLALRSAIENLLNRCYEEGFEVDNVTADMSSSDVSVSADAFQIKVQTIGSIDDGTPIINLVNFMILQAVRQGASDLHIEPDETYSSVRYRIDGELREVLRPRTEFHPAIISRIKVMSRMDIAEHRLPQDGRVCVIVDGRQIDLRVSTLPTVLGEKAVLRVLDRESVTFELSQLGFRSQQLSEVNQMLSKPYGLMLVTGPTGSGKTTTLYSAIELIKSVKRNIVTVEDPVEYQLKRINQVHANTGTNLTFARALRSILRQDPDVIMIGEIRDSETAEIAIQAALTGHLVLSTLHTNDAASAVMRLVDMGVAPYKIAAAFVGVVAQRLVRTVCQECRTLYYPEKTLLDELKYQGDRERQFVRGEGCQVCYDTGFRGRVGLYEVLSGTRELRDLIAENPRVDVLRDWHCKQGGRSLLEEGISRAEEGITSLDEVAQVALFD
ncbi:GspE/PulE family protein [Thalassoroseus pseudoceratinae]|uniref:GspE/PulE family protein n=1 Tax=Thalassoroseus pseudoceratinae TaxID=2713176 RepID=UPI00142196D9|nr:GspE/PulE family protein [Thalassoroseus pseudoceratinae]